LAGLFVHRFDQPHDELLGRGGECRLVHVLQDLSDPLMRQERPPRAVLGLRERSVEQRKPRSLRGRF
jgi:hypothetical protein